MPVRYSPLADQFLDSGAIFDDLRALVVSGDFTLGRVVAEFEAAFARQIGVKHAIGVGSGTDALKVPLKAVGVGYGDEVITAANTFWATVGAIAEVGARPVFIDIDPLTYNIDPAKLVEKITPKTKAIIPVHLTGRPADMDVIMALARKHNLFVIEDAAQSFGASYQGQRSCHTSPIATTSFFPSKPLGCYGDGGAIFLEDAELAKACRELRVHGQSARYLHTRIGVGGRMDTLQCAVVLAKLGRLDWEIERRQQIGARYHALLADVPGVTLLTVRPDRDSVWGQYTVQVAQREAVQAFLQAEGVPTAIHYPRPLNRQPAFEAISRSHGTANSDWLAARVMSLPMSADLTEADQDRVVETLRRALASLPAQARRLKLSTIAPAPVGWSTASWSCTTGTKNPSPWT